MDTKKRIAIREVGVCLSVEGRSLLVQRCRHLLATHEVARTAIVRIEPGPAGGDEQQWVIKVAILLEGGRLYGRQERGGSPLQASVRALYRVDQHLWRRACLEEAYAPSAAHR